MIIRTYHIKHRQDFSSLLERAKLVADYAVSNKRNKKLLTSKYVKHFGLPSTIANQILRKYSRGNIKEVSNINLVILNAKTKIKNKIGIKVYQTIDYSNERVIIKPLNVSFRWNPGKQIEEIKMVEITNEKFMVSATFPNKTIDQPCMNVLGLDLNCGIGRHIVNAADLKSNNVLNLGKSGPNIRKKYFKKRKKQKIKGNKEKRIMKDLDHKISKAIVDYAFKNKLKIVVEDLKGIRKTAKKGNDFKGKNRSVNSWSFYRLQQFIEYKSKERGIPFEKVKPHYTSQECSYCHIIGNRNKDIFICKNKKCKKFNQKRHADVNAAYNVGYRSLQLGGRTR
jgi:IS605 OrfB family transposase